MQINQDKTVSANYKGILISFRDVNKHRFLAYEHVDKIQKFGTVRYQPLERNLFNKKQQRIYSQTIHGLRYFEAAQVEKMPLSKREQIVENCAKAQKVLNRWKQQVVSQAVDGFLLALFPKSPIVKQFTSLPCTDDEYTDSHTFKELGITQTQIAEKLIKHGLLPNNFFQLA